MNKEGTRDTPAVVLASKAFKPGHFKALSLGDGKFVGTGKARISSYANWCSHCGNQKHTRDNCFKLHGYPEWWADFQAKRKGDIVRVDGTMGKAAVVEAIPHLSLTPLETPHGTSQ